MPFKLTTAPTITPIDIDYLKQHSVISIDDDDILIDSYIKAAVNWAEGFTRRAFLTQTYDLYLDAFPKKIILPRPPLQSVVQIQYTDTNGANQVLATTEYTVDTVREPGIVIEAYNKTWPSTRDDINVVNVTFKAGYSSVDLVPAAIKQAIALIAAHFYENRENASPTSMVNIPMSAKDLLYLYKVYTL